MIRILHYPLKIEYKDKLDNDMNLIKERVIEEQLTSFAFEEGKEELRIQVKTQYCGLMLEKDIVLSKQVQKAYDIVLLRTDIIGELVINEIYSKIDTNNFSIGRGSDSNTKKLARVIFNTKEDIVIAIYDRCNNIEGYENIERERGTSLTGQLKSLCPWLNEMFPRYRKKGDLIKNIDIYKSVSYLEAQVDILTKIILSLAPNTELKEVLKLADENSILNIKPLDDIKKEFTESKYNFRKKQEKYYVELQE